MYVPSAGWQPQRALIITEFTSQDVPGLLIWQVQAVLSPVMGASWCVGGHSDVVSQTSPSIHNMFVEPSGD